MKFKDLFKNLKNIDFIGDENVEIKGIASSIDEVKEGYCYIASSDTKKAEINDAIKNGAIAIVVDKKRQTSDKVVNAMVLDLNIAKAAISSTFYDNPSTKIKLIAVLGDERRLITAMLIREGLQEAGKKVGIITKAETGIKGSYISRDNKLDSVFIQRKLAEFYNEKIEYVILEIPLEKVASNDVLGCKFEEVVLTKTDIDTENFREKLDGGTIEEFLEKHYKVFKWSNFNIINNDDLLSDEIKKISKKHITYGITNEADYNAFDINLRHTRVDFLVRIEGSVQRIIINIPGMQTVEAALGALGALLYLGIKPKQSIRAFNKLKINGLLELVENKENYAIFIDGSNNAKEIAETVKGLRAYVTGDITAIIGADEELSDEEREEIGRSIGKKVNLSIITTGNYNKKDPKELAKPILRGIRQSKGKSIQILDRKEAIEYTLARIARRDLLIIFKSYNNQNGSQAEETNERKIINEFLNKE